MDKWQDIASAPKERCAALLFYANSVLKDVNGQDVTEAGLTQYPLRAQCWKHSLAVWDGEAWIDADTGHDVIEDWTLPEDRPTHWLPLPTPPETTA